MSMVLSTLKILIFLFVLFCFFVCFERVSLYSPSCPGTQAVLKLTGDLSASASKWWKFKHHPSIFETVSHVEPGLVLLVTTKSTNLFPR